MSSLSPMAATQALFEAIERGTVADCRSLLERGANPNGIRAGNGMLARALGLDNKEEATTKACLLLEHGANWQGPGSIRSPIGSVMAHRLLTVLEAMLRTPGMGQEPLKSTGGLLVAGAILGREWWEGWNLLRDHGVDVRWYGFDQGDPELPIAALVWLLKRCSERKKPSPGWVDTAVWLFSQPVPGDGTHRFPEHMAEHLVKLRPRVSPEVFKRLETAWLEGPWWEPAAGRLAASMYLQELAWGGKRVVAIERSLRRLVEEKSLVLFNPNDQHTGGSPVEVAMRTCGNHAIQPRVLQRDLKRYAWVLEHCPPEALSSQHIVSGQVVPAWVAGFGATDAPLELLEPLIRRGVDVSVVETMEWNPQNKSYDPALVNRFPLGHLVSASNPKGALAWFRANPGRIHEVDSQGMGLLHRLASHRWSAGANQGFVWAPFVRAVMEARGDLGALTPQGSNVLHLLLDNPSAWWVESFEDVIAMLCQASPGLLEQPDEQGRRPWEMLAEWLREKEQKMPLRAWPRLKALLHGHRLSQTLEDGIPAGEAGRARL